MKLKELYNRYFLNKESIKFTWSEKILFEILSDLTERSGLGKSWENIDEETQEKIMTFWIRIITSFEPNPWNLYKDIPPPMGEEVLTYSPKSEHCEEQFRIISYGSVGGGFPYGVEKWKYLRK